MKQSTIALLLGISGAVVLGGGMLLPRELAIPYAACICIAAGFLAVAALILGIRNRKESMAKASIAISTGVCILTTLILIG